MISKIVAFKSSNGETFETLEQVQRHEVGLILQARLDTSGPADIATDVAAEVIVKNAEKVIDILSTKANSRPVARKSNGATKKRRTTLAAPTIAVPPEDTR